MNRRLPHTDTHDHATSKISCEGPCPVMRACGGCEWLNLPYRKQLTRKQHAMEELFGPLIAELDLDCSVEPVRGMGANAGDTGKIASPRGFRHKAASPFAPAGKNHIASGFLPAALIASLAFPIAALKLPALVPSSIALHAPQKLAIFPLMRKTSAAAFCAMPSSVWGITPTR